MKRKITYRGGYIKTIKIKCPHCNTNIKIKFNNNMEILSVKHDNTECLSEIEIAKALKDKGIELG